MLPRLPVEDSRKTSVATFILPDNVRLARNIIATMGMFLICVGIGALAMHPAKVEDWLCFSGVALFCFNLVRQVNRGEGGWLDHVCMSRKASSEPQMTEEEEANG